MKKLAAMLGLFFVLGTLFTGCREDKSAEERMEEGMEHMEEGAEEVGDEVEEGAEELEDEIKDTIDD